MNPVPQAPSRTEAFFVFIFTLGFGCAIYCVEPELECQDGQQTRYGAVDDFLADDKNQVSLEGYDALITSPYDASGDDGPI